MARLLLVIPTLNRGGAERVVSVLSQSWARRHTVTVACFDCREHAYPIGGRLVDFDLPGGPGYVAKGIGMLRRACSLLQLIAKSRFHRIIAFTEAANLPTLLACLILGRQRRLWVSVRESATTIPRPERWLMRLLYNLPAGIVAPSRGVARGLVGTIGLRATRIRTLPNPLDPTMRQVTPVPVPRPFLLAAGRLVAVKDFAGVIAAFARIASTHDLDLVILGEGPLRSALETAAHDLHISGRVRLVGAQAEPWAWMAACTIFVLGSRHEGWPNALAEALALGRPCVATDCDAGPRELIRDGYDGLLVPVGDPVAMAEAFLRLLNDPVLASHLGAAAAKRMEAFATQHGAEAWLHSLDQSLPSAKGT